MKNLIAMFVTTLVGSSACAQTSVYHPFPDSNVVWNVESSSQCSVGVANRFWDSFIIQGDTIIDLNSYHKVYLAWRIEHWPCAGFYFSYPGYYYGALRQDTAARTVYYYDSQDTAERLLYDFNLNVGDTVRGYLKSFGCQDDSVIIDQDSVFIDGNYRKRWKVPQWFGPDYIIEGIGYTGGPFSPICSWDEGGSVLICCTQENNVLFQDSLYTTTPGNCDVINRLPNFENKEKAAFYPNPLLTSGYFITPHYPCTIAIYNVLGEKIHELKCESGKTILNREGFTSGIYFYVIADQNELIGTGKLIVE